MLGWSEEVATSMLQAANDSSYRMLPTYSPELNPVELIFAFVKDQLRKRPIDADLESSIREVMATIDRGDVIHYYLHCGYFWSQ